MLCTEDVVRRLSAKYRKEGEGQEEEEEEGWGEEGWGDGGAGAAGACGSEDCGTGKKGGVGGKRWWRQEGLADVDVVDVGVRCVKGKGEMRHSFSKSTLF